MSWIQHEQFNRTDKYENINNDYLSIIDKQWG